MLYKKEIDDEIKDLQGLKQMVQIYSEIASIRMIKIRNHVLKNRRFLDSIHDIFKDALSAYSAKLSVLARRGKLEKGGKITFLAHNGKTVAVFISANTGFYGDVVPRTFEKFLDDINNEDVEVTIIGRLGLSLFQSTRPNEPHTFFNLPDYGIDQNKLSQIIRHLVQYEKIRVYYGKYQSVVTQKPTKMEITAGTPITDDIEEPEVKYLFEPSVEKILTFFETQIFASLFDQSIRESQLAKFASRIIAMDSAGENIRKHIDKMNLTKLRVEHRNKNRKQLNTLTSVYYQK